MVLRSLLGRAAVAQAAALLMPAVAIFVVAQGPSKPQLDCGGRDVTQEIVKLFRRQLKLTPYARFIDVANADVRVAAVFDVAAPAGMNAPDDKASDAKAPDTKMPDDPSGNARACVAFATYHAQFNEAGEKVEGHRQLQSSLLDELSGEKQIFYSIRRTPEGKRAVRINRISG